MPELTAAVAYLRVSTERQAQSGLGLEAQRAAIETWSRKNQVHIEHWFTDEAKSGAAGGEDDMGARPALASALNSLRKGSVLVVAKRDRLARDVLLAAWISKEAKKRGAKIISCAGEGTEDNTPTGRLLSAIIDAFSAWEREQIAQRTRDAHARLKANGRWPGGKPKLGYRIEAGALVVDEREKETVELVRHLRALGKSYAEIVERLNTEGHRARGKRWHVNSVRRILAQS